MVDAPGPTQPPTTVRDALSYPISYLCHLLVAAGSFERCSFMFGVAKDVLWRHIEARMTREEGGVCVRCDVMTNENEDDDNAMS